MFGYAEQGLEVRPSESPETVQDSKRSPLELISPIEVCYPEVVIAQGPEIKEPSEQLLSEPQKEGTFSPGDSRRKKRPWVVIITVAIVLILAAVGICVGLTLRRRSGTSKSSSVHSPTSSGPSGNSTSNQPPVRATIASNTSVAAASCDNGDRWVFLQDVVGNIRGAHFTFSTSRWTVASDALNFATPQLQTGLGASCANISALEDASDDVGSETLISLVYLNNSNALQQSTFSEGSWADSPVPPALQPPDNNTKLIVSTDILPFYSDSPNASFSEAFNPELSTVVMYQSKNSLVMVNIEPFSDSGENRTSSKNLFSQLVGAPTLPLTGESFSCIYNGLIPPDDKQLYAQCYFVDSTSGPPTAILWEYNQSALYDNHAIPASNTKSASNTDPSIFDSLLVTDLSLLLLPADKQALVTVLANNTLAIFLGNVASPPDNWPYIAPTPLPASTSLFGATSLTQNSTMVYVYYQENGTAIAEMAFDTSDRTWNDRIAYLAVS
ncbi:hypothetical protein MMC14_010405 [Varicellaria rhodocarpa]|nr:hypothetical protein [Varicellaria rhodocarpa]